MTLPLYLAVTGEDFSSVALSGDKLAWMACHFSPTGAGLCDLPPELPVGSMVMLNDALPFHNHRVENILPQLQALTAKCSGVLLDFQRPYNEKLRQLVYRLATGLSCPVGVPPGYARGLSCPVFLPPVPLNKTPQAYFAPWKGREIWLDVALDGLQIAVTAKGSRFTPLADPVPGKPVFTDARLHCDYYTALTESGAQFTLYRTRKTLNSLLAAAEKFGVTRCIGLYQELYKTSL